MRRPPLPPIIRFSSSSSSSSSFSTKPKWNSNPNLRITHPVLSLVESCASMAQLRQIQAHMTRTGLIAHRFPRAASSPSAPSPTPATFATPSSSSLKSPIPTPTYTTP
uniref:Uncharacterized protein n=1 Tax=Ananas comosus var. bracteatus TaxID=296719 RepID=A0A6V7NNV0_ANACO|nr:unnamed protein product [Ananas comosus var. bracteatus]